MKTIDYSLYLITDDPSRYVGNWLDNVVAAVEGGVTCVQYRDTESTPEVQFERIRRLKDAIGPTPIVVNNDPELARAVGARGVHVGQHDLPPEEVRQIVGPLCEIGLSITDVFQVPRLKERLLAGTVDCIGIGPVFDATKTKSDASPAMGTEGLRAIAALVPDVPNCAIGGITLENAASVLSAGAHGLALVSAFSRSENPHEAARSFALLSHNRRK